VEKKVVHTLKLIARNTKKRGHMAKSINSSAFKDYLTPSKKPLLAFLLFSLLIINASSIWNFFILKSNFDSVSSRLDKAITISLSTGSVQYLMAILYNKMIEIKGNRVNSIDDSKNDIFMAPKLEGYFMRGQEIREDKGFSNILKKHICDIAAQSFISEKHYSIADWATSRCPEIVPDRNSFTIAQAVNTIMLQYRDFTLSMASQNRTVIDNLVTSDEYLKFDELIFYYINSAKNLLAELITSIQEEIDKQENGITDNVIIFTSMIILSLIVYKVIWLTNRTRTWRRIKYSHLVLNDQLISVDTIKRLMK
jgi:hypothetical protein